MIGLGTNCDMKQAKKGGTVGEKTLTTCHHSQPSKPHHSQRVMRLLSCLLLDPSLLPQCLNEARKPIPPESNFTHTKPNQMFSHNGQTVISKSFVFTGQVKRNSCLNSLNCQFDKKKSCLLNGNLNHTEVVTAILGIYIQPSSVVFLVMRTITKYNY